MLKLYISHFTLLWFFKVLENLVVDFKKKNIYESCCQSNCEPQNVIFFKVFPRSDDTRIFVELPIEKVVVTK